MNAKHDYTNTKPLFEEDHPPSFDDQGPIVDWPGTAKLLAGGAAILALGFVVMYLI